MENTNTTKVFRLDGEMKVIGAENLIIPQCCKEGWDSCPHTVKKQKKTKKNIGL